MVGDKAKVCLDCKSKLPATLEYFNKTKKGKYGLDDVCRDCLYRRSFGGIGSRRRKRGYQFIKIRK